METINEGVGHENVTIWADKNTYESHATLTPGPVRVPRTDSHATITQGPVLLQPEATKYGSINCNSSRDSSVGPEVENNGCNQPGKSEVAIDFSNINDAASASTTSASPSSKPMISNQKDNTIGFYKSAPYRRLEHPADKSLFLAFLGGIVFLILALVIMCPALALVIILLPLGMIIKSCLMCCCCCKSGKPCQYCCSNLLNHSETFWLHDSQFNKMVTQSLITLEQGLDFGRIRDLVNARMISAENKSGSKLYPRFTQRLIPLNSGYAWVQDTSFNIDKHFFAMPSNIKSQEDLQKHIGQLATQDMPSDKPLWELHILSDFGEEKDTIILFRLHPSVCDGITCIQILLASLTDNQPGIGLKIRFGRTAYLFNMLRSFVIGPLVFLQKSLFAKRDVNVLHGPKLSGEKVVAWSEPFNYGAAYRTKQVTRTALNDVLLSATAGCLRTCMQVQGVPNPFDIIANIPVDLRSYGSNIHMGVEFTLVPVTIPTNTEGAIPRLWQVRHFMDDLKNSVDPTVMYGTLWVLLNMLPECLTQKIFHSTYSKASCLISNLQGPETLLTFGSREIKNMMYWLPPAGDSSLSISFLSYADEIRMAVIADRDVLPNPEILTKDFIFQMQKLSLLLSHRRIPGEHPSRRAMDLPHEEREEPSEPSTDQLQQKMSEVQIQLQELKARLDEETDERFSDEEEALVNRVEELREEFRELLAELRRKRATTSSGTYSEDDDDLDGELRRSYRRRTFSGTSRRSILSTISATRPPITPPLQSRHMSLTTPSSDAPSSPTFTHGHGTDHPETSEWRKGHMGRRGTTH